MSQIHARVSSALVSMTVDALDKVLFLIILRLSLMSGEDETIGVHFEKLLAFLSISSMTLLSNRVARK